MSIKEVIIIVVTGLLMFGLYLTQRERLKAYDECVMIRTTENWNYDCVLTEGGENYGR